MIETDDTEINLYDQNSKESGHGGYAFLGSLPTLVGEKNGIEYSLALSWPQAGCALPEDLSLVLRGLRSLNLTNGETIFINTQLTAIEPNDPRLQEILTEKTQPCSVNPELRSVAYEGVEKRIKNELFGDLNNLAANERQAINRIEDTLKAISPK